MSYEADIYRAVKECVTLWDSIGGRFSWDIADSSTVAPYVVAQTISDSGQTTHDGTRDVSFPSIQFSCWAKTKAEAITITDEIRRELEGVNLPGESFCSLSFSNRISQYDSTARLYGIILQYRASIQLPTE